MKVLAENILRNVSWTISKFHDMSWCNSKNRPWAWICASCTSRCSLTGTETSIFHIFRTTVL